MNLRLTVYKTGTLPTELIPSNLRAIDGEPSYGGLFANKQTKYIADARLALAYMEYEPIVELLQHNPLYKKDSDAFIQKHHCLIPENGRKVNIY